MTDPLRASVAPRLDETGRETPCVHRSSWFSGSGSERGRGTNQKGAKEHPEWSFLAGIPELHDITWIDLPTSHWPMWSRPAELAAIIGAVATKASAARAAGASR